MSTFLATHNTAFAAGFSALLAVWVAGFGVASAQGFTPGRYGFGTPATPELIAALDVDVRADGHGLPPVAGPMKTARCCLPSYARTATGKTFWAAVNAAAP